MRHTLLLALVCCASLAGGAEVQTLSPETLKETVFLDRQPWVVVCLSGSKSDPVHDVVGKATAAAGFPSDVRVGVLNCRAKLPSGKTAIVRLKLDDNIEPLIFVVAGGEVTQVTPNGLNKHPPKATAKQPRELFPSSKAHARSLAAFVAFATEVRVAKITSDKELSACLAKSCALFLTAQDVSSSQQTLIDKLGAKFRHTRFAVLNLGRYEFSLESKLPAQPTRQEPRLLLLRQLEAVEAEEKKEEKKRAKGKAAQQLGARAYRGDWSAGGMEGFMTEALGSETDVVRLKQPPSVRWRSAKKTEPTVTPSKGAKAKAGAKDAAAEAALRERVRRQAMDTEGNAGMFVEEEEDEDAEDDVEELQIDEDEDEGAEASQRDEL
ncbi:hypothetical protein T492DRAFT_1091537 [Pavlovales sp. CCMP2436]|nr:hypothetical protein T492DRAFT_1091537 [Pavlovales sp. CCMP2436]